MTRIASRVTLEALHVSTMSSRLSIATPSSDADSLNSSWGRRNDMLPYEILSAIFSYISHDHILHLRHLLFVCRSWSIVILTEAELWSSIRIDYEIHRYFDIDGEFNNAQAANLISLCISRSRAHPLSIILDFSAFATWSRLVKVDLRLKLIPLIGILVRHLDQHALRWYSLECHDLVYVSEIVSILPLHIPHLKCLRLYGFQWDERKELIFPDCPNLEVVELHEHQEYDMQLFGECHVHTVKELLVESKWVWQFEDVCYIARFRSILRLTLVSSLDGAGFGMADPKKIHLPQLKVLRLMGCIHSALVGLLSAPSLNKIEFDHNESITSIASHLVSTDIKTIAALIPPPILVSPHVTVAAALIDLVASLHGLRTLRVKRWIHDVITAGDSPLSTSAILGLRLVIED